MNIVHIAPNAPYNDYWGYQENLLPKYQVKMGHDVTLIITNMTHRGNDIVETDCADYFLNDGVRVIRLKKKSRLVSRLTRLCSHLHVLPYLQEIKPNFIFYHGLVSTSIFEVIAYKKQYPDCIVVQDNHLDYNIGPACITFKDWVRRTFYWSINKLSVSHVERVYGVTPWRKKYAEDYFRIPKDKTDVLIMGADDEKIHFSERDIIREAIRRKYGVSEEDFLIVTGGKIDHKKKIHHLMEAVSRLDGVRLLVFGSIAEDMKSQFFQILDTSPNISYIGWIDSDAVYDYFFAADLVFFPGQHSVLWEQACAAKVPCVFEQWEGMDHVNNGGNSDFVADVSPKVLEDKIMELLYTEKYYKMKEIAASEATDIYLYSKIAEKSLEYALIK